MKKGKKSAPNVKPKAVKKAPKAPVSRKTVESKKANQAPIQPLGDKVLVKEIKDIGGTETKSGIIIPDSVDKDKGCKKGTVVAVGSGSYKDSKLVEVAVSVGNTVLYQWGDVITVNGEEYQVVSENNIIAIIN